MNITTDNYEAFFLDYFEGNLAPDKVDELLMFIDHHPELKKEFDEFEMVSLVPDNTIIFSKKESLKKNERINDSNYDEFLIKEVEGIITSQEQSDLDRFIAANPTIARERKLYGLTKLQPDTSIVFADKTSLTHTIIPIRRIVLYTLSAAASIALLFGVYFVYQSSFESGSQVKVAVNKTNTGKLVSVPEQTTTPVISIQTREPNSKGTPIEQEDKTHFNSASTQVQPEIMTEEYAYTRSAEVMPTLACSGYPELRSHDYVAPEFMMIRASQMHTNEYMELYYNVRLAEQIQYAQLNETDANPEKTIFNNISSKVSSLFNPVASKAESENTNLSVWTFAELGVKTYNNLAHDNVKLDLQRDEQGKVVAYNISGDRLDLQRDVNERK